MKLVIASNNKGKIREYKQLLAPLGYEAVSQSEVGIKTQAEETGTTFAQNAAIKAREIFGACGYAVLADDSGLAVDALNGEPGVYSARYGGLKTDKEHCALLLERMRDIPDEERGAHFVCAIHFIKQSGEEITAQGRVDGKIGYEPIGENGFGYDPIFMYESKSFAQTDPQVKNAVSHRAMALKALLEKLKEKG